MSVETVQAVLSLGLGQQQRAIDAAVSVPMVGAALVDDIDIAVDIAASAATIISDNRTSSASPLVLFLLLLDPPEQPQQSYNPVSYLYRLTTNMLHQLTPEQSHILGRAIAITASVVTVGFIAVTSYYVLVKKWALAILRTHEEIFPSMIHASNSWPSEGRAFRAKTTKDAADKLVLRLQTLRDGNATSIAMLEAISDSLMEIPFTAKRLETVQEDLERAEDYVERLPHLMAAISSTLAYLTPSGRRFANGMKDIRGSYEFVIADKTASWTQKAACYATLWTLGEYTFEDATRRVEEQTAVARMMLKQRREELKVLRELLPEATARLELARTQ